MLTVRVCVRMVNSAAAAAGRSIACSVCVRRPNAALTPRRFVPLLCRRQASGGWAWAQGDITPRARAPSSAPISPVTQRTLAAPPGVSPPARGTVARTSTPRGGSGAPQLAARLVATQRDAVAAAAQARFACAQARKSERAARGAFERLRCIVRAQC
jgi:hypothetical protein